MIFNNFTLRHTAIYIGGIISLVVLNIYQLHQFQSSIIAETEQLRESRNYIVVYHFMKSYECESREVIEADNDEYFYVLYPHYSVARSGYKNLHPSEQSAYNELYERYLAGQDYYKELHAEYSVKQSEVPCTALNYYLIGEGLFYLALIPLFLILFPFFPGSFANQRIYNRAFYLSLAIVVFMLLNLFFWYDYNLESGSQSGFTRVGSYEIFFFVTPVLYLCFLLCSWGRHRENWFKLLLLTTCLLAVIPLYVLYGLARIF